MTRPLHILPVAMVSLSPSLSFVVPSASLVRMRLTWTSSKFNNNRSASQEVARRCPRRMRVNMMAKKKRGPAADALAQLEVLEAAEAVDTAGKEVATVVERPAPGKKKGGKKKRGPAADALAQHEALESSEASEALDTVAKEASPLEAPYNIREGPEAKPALAGAETEEEVVNLMQPRLQAGKGKKKSKGKKGAGEEEKVSDSQAHADTSPVAGKYADMVVTRAGDAGVVEKDGGIMEDDIGSINQPPLRVVGEDQGKIKGLDRVMWDERGASQEAILTPVAEEQPGASSIASVESMDEDEDNVNDLIETTSYTKEKEKKSKRLLVEDELPKEFDAEVDLAEEDAASLSIRELNPDREDQRGGNHEETLEAKIRKTRPPPRVRISSTAQPGYVSLRLEGVAVTFRNQEVVKDATWEVKTGDRLGLVGPNGGGKTTQIKILAGDLQPTAGEVVKSSKDLRVAFLRQEFVDELVMHRSLKEELTSVFTEESDILTKLQACEDELQDKGVQEDPEKMEKVLNHLSQLQEDAERKHVYDLPTRVQRIMDLMGFDVSEGDQPVSSFSGGWRMRIGLGKILLKDPNILLLDEPTNHLDMESVEWLERFLENQSIPMVIVSHDREFLDRVCTGIVDTDGGVAISYPGNYSKFLKLKRARREAWEAAYRNQQKKIKEERNWINKFKSKGAWASQVKSREKALEKLIAGNNYVKQPPNTGKPFRFRFPPAPRAGSEEIITVNGVGHGYNGRTLFGNVNFTVDKGDRIAFLGPNGAGKSTLLRLLVGQEEPHHGTCILGSSVVKQYFEQNQADALDLSKTVMETMMGASSIEKYEDLRKLLGQFLFKGDAVDKSVEQLSGGEKARVALCKMMLTPANLLVLDEPTNHLDIPAKEMLEEALQHYEGAVLVVSHDRYFVSQVATTICNFEDNSLVRYDGDYRYFLERNDNILEKVESRYVAGVAGIQKAKRVDLQELSKPSKSFGGKGGPSGRKDKGVKNAKRHAESVV